VVSLISRQSIDTLSKWLSECNGICAARNERLLTPSRAKFPRSGGSVGLGYYQEDEGGAGYPVMALGIIQYWKLEPPPTDWLYVDCYLLHLDVFRRLIICIVSLLASPCP
jgi:hypothetical protein